MKWILFTALFITTAFFSQAQEITVEEIVNNYAENTGGRDAWMAVDNMVMTASMTMQGMDFPLEIIRRKDGKQLTKFSFQGKEMVQDAFDGETMWGVNFMTMKPEKSDSEQTENHKRTIGEFPDALLTYDEMGYTLELDGEDNIDGVDCYKLKLTKKSQLVEGEEVDNIEYYYMDKENFIPIAQEKEMLSGQMKGQVVQTLFSDYQEVDGFYFPFSILTQYGEMAGQTVVIESVELNKTMDDSIFIFSEGSEK